MERRAPKKYLIVEATGDGIVNLQEMKRWCRLNPTLAPLNIDPDRDNSQKLARAFRNAGWEVIETATELRISRTPESAAQAASMLDPEESVDDDGESSDETAFALERQLQEFIATNLPAIRVNGKRLRLYTDDVGDGTEYPTSSNRRIDILAQDDENNFVVFELKRGLAPDSAIGQLLNYMGWVKLNLAKGGNVSGVIVARKINERLREAIVMTDNISLFEYQLKFDLRPISKATSNQ
ncbi:DUF91 domain-containing protein [Candidimonas sp. SYP-B2681]|uniref:endonuclease NucS domain-containing protein n=1 Tax=Candidimonas sp. SYP-B2681 TaxID=2497686 RepID=UPI000F88437A|nr:endonuclease NucS domain-containing protein [Candidimonas sp. SYP-B2681]RTZ43399.1 DUF91 domain-containing protein [Candidimonas sp. SYP-B2681]